MALVQQRMEETTNRHRDSAVLFKVEDKIWLDLNKVKTTRMYKKLDVKYAKYTVVEIIGLYIYRLDTLLEIHLVQSIKRLCLAVINPFSKQQLTNA